METLTSILYLAFVIKLIHDSVFGLQGLNNLQLLKKNGVPAKGIFVNKKQSETMRGNSFFCKLPFQFTDDRNDLHEAPISIFNWKYRKAQPGQEIAILYDKKNPSVFYPEEDINKGINTNYFWIALLFVFLTLTIIRANV